MERFHFLFRRLFSNWCKTLYGCAQVWSGDDAYILAQGAVTYEIFLSLRVLHLLHLFFLVHALMYLYLGLSFLLTLLCLLSNSIIVTVVNAVSYDASWVFPSRCTNFVLVLMNSCSLFSSNVVSSAS